MRRCLEWFFSLRSLRCQTCVQHEVKLQRLYLVDQSHISVFKQGCLMFLRALKERKYSLIFYHTTTLANRMLQTSSNYMKHNSKCHTNLDTFPPLHFQWPRDRLYRSHYRRSPDGFKVFIHGWCIYQQNFVQSCLRHHKPTQKTPFCCEHQRERWHWA